MDAVLINQFYLKISRSSCKKNCPPWHFLLAASQGSYSMPTIRYVVKAICYDKSVSISAIRYALKRVTIPKVDLFYAPFAVQ